jgi:hypothetical protein
MLARKILKVMAYMGPAAPIVSMAAKGVPVAPSICAPFVQHCPEQSPRKPQSRQTLESSLDIVGAEWLTYFHAG